MMAILRDLVHDVPMLSAGRPCTNEATEVANGGKFIARVAFAPRLIVLLFPVLFPELFPEPVTFSVGGKFHGG